MGPKYLVLKEIVYSVPTLRRIPNNDDDNSRLKVYSWVPALTAYEVIGFKQYDHDRGTQMVSGGS